MIGFKQWNICVVHGNARGVPSRNYIEELTRTFVFKEFVEPTYLPIPTFFGSRLKLIFHSKTFWDSHA